MCEHKQAPDVQIIVNPKVTSPRFFIHLAREFRDEASADAHFAHIKPLTGIEGSHLTVFEANLNGKWIVVLFEEVGYGREADKLRVESEFCKAGLPIQLAPAVARKLGDEIIDAGL